MRFYLQQNVLCLTYQHPLLLDRSRGWAPKNHFSVVESLRHPQPEHDRTATPVELDDVCRFEGEDGSEAPVLVRELAAIPLERARGARSAAP